MSDEKKSDEKQTTAIAKSDAATPADLLRLAVDQGADLERLERLMELQIRWEAREAKKQYNAALARFRAECPAIVQKDGSVEMRLKTGQVMRYRHATLGAIAGAVSPHLGTNGLTYSWSIDQSEKGLVAVTCTLDHVAGHSTSVSMTAPHDDSGQKNRIQQVASTVTYLQRYTLQSVLGIVTADDPDGQSFAPVQPPDDSLGDEIDALMQAFEACESVTLWSDLARDAGRYKGAARTKLLAASNACKDRLGIK